MKRTSLAILLSSLILCLPASAHAGLLAPEGTCPGDTISNPDYQTGAAAMKCLINYTRSQVGAVPLQIKSRLNRSSMAKTQDMLNCNVFSHEACGRDPYLWIKKYYCNSGKCLAYAENIAFGAGSPYNTARSTMNGWLNSSAHYAQIIKTKFRDFGIGLINSNNYMGYPKAAIWTMHFGRKR